MIHYIQGNLLDEFEKGTVNIIAHQASCQHVMGGGIAKQIKERYPEAYEADLDTPKGSSKLGTFSGAKNKFGRIVNLYGQDGFSTKERQTDYGALYKALEHLKKFIEASPDDLTLGMPHLLGCGLAGGNWDIVKAMIKDLFFNAKFNTYIIKLDDKQRA